MKRNSNLDTTFAAARSEQNPVPIHDAGDLHEVLQRKASKRRSSSGLVVLAVYATMLFAVLGGSWLWLSEEQEKQPGMATVTASHLGNPAVASSAAVNTTGARRAPADEVSGELQPTTKRTSRNNNSSRIRQVIPSSLMRLITSSTTDDDVYVAALLADEDLFRSLSIEPAAVKEICRNLAGADSVTNCSVGQHDTQVKVCVFSDGAQDEVVFMDRPGPMPVMFTSANGQGRVVTSRYSSSVDPNKLIPVAAHGCGGNVLMWFSPTEEFVYSLPDSLGKKLNNAMELDIQMNAFGKNLHIRKKVGAIDSLHRMNLKQTVDSVLKSLQFELDSIGKAVGGDINQLKQLLSFTSDQPNTIHSVLGSNVENRIVVISCGRVDNKASVPTKSTPLQETRITDGAMLRTNVYPNPSQTGEVTVDFELYEPRLVSVSLLDLGGVLIRSWATNTWRNSGQNSMEYSLEGIPAGMYLITLSTDRNERVVQRLIVQ